MYKILLVDDSKLAQVEISNKLKADGYDLYYAANGKEAVEKTIKLMPDIIVMDVIMPVMDGLEAIMNIKRMYGAVSEIPVIVCSSKDTMTDYEKSLSAGAVTHIKKPIEYARLKKKIEELVSKI